MSKSLTRIHEFAVADQKNPPSVTTEEQNKITGVKRRNAGCEIERR